MNVNSIRVAVRLMSIFAVFVIGGESLVYGQEQSLTFKKKNYQNQPIELTSIELYGREIKPETPVIVTREWLPGFAIQVKNISSRTIKHIEIRLTTPTTADTGAAFFCQLRKGRSLFLPPELQARTGEELTLLPGETTTVQASPNLIKKVYDNNARTRMPDNFRDQTLLLIVEAVFFDDNSAWMTGAFFKQKDARTWVVDEQRTSMNLNEPQ